MADLLHVAAVAAEALSADPAQPTPSSLPMTDTDSKAATPDGGSRSGGGTGEAEDAVLIDVPRGGDVPGCHYI